MGDPRFAKTVILLAEAGEDGALGFVVNRRTPFTFEDLAGDVGLSVGRAIRQNSVHYGGPVSPERGWVLFRKQPEPVDENVIEVGDELCVSANVDVLKPFFEGSDPSPFKLVLGYAGWGPTQLEDEIREGSWIPFGLDPSMVFDVPEDEMWATALARLGLKPGTFVMGGSGAKA
jgi:putative transcriptional regulator